jgi:hypothetical protein
MYSLILVSHIIGGVLTLILGIVSILSILFNKTQMYSKLAKSLVAIALFQSISGLALIFTTNTSMLTVCLQYSVYFLFVILVEMLLLWRISLISISKVIYYNRVHNG